MIRGEKISHIIGNLHRLTSDIFGDAIQRKLILDNLSEGVFTVGPDLRITSFNKAAENITGLAEAEALGRVCTDLFNYPGKENFSVISQALAERQSIRKVIRHLIVAGHCVPVLVNGSVLIDQWGDCVGGIQSFQEIDEIFHRQLILDSIFDGVFTVDLDLRITLLNTAAQQLTGLNQRDVIGRHMDEIFIPGNRVGSHQAPPLRLSISTGIPVSEHSYFLEVNNGRVLPVSVNAAPLLNARGEIIGGVETFRDNTDRLQADLVLDSVADGVFTVTPDFVITSFNKAAEQITGYRADEVLGKRCGDVFQPKNCTKNCPIANSLEIKGKVIADDVVFVAKSGKPIPVSVSSTVLLDGNGHIIGGVGIFRDLTEITSLKRQLSAEAKNSGIISRSAKMQRIMSVLPHFAKSDSTILVLGESGTGKELIAKAIHNLSTRHDKPFVAVNSGALPDSLLESELFGYKAGAFTDARKDKRGRFAAAEKGTLFLDEIGDISQAMQVKLLRVLQSRMYEPLGSNTPVQTDVRIIAATNKNLTEMVKDNTFREDLYYRLNVVKVELPPLRERLEDIPLLVEHFIHKFNGERGKNVKGISEEALAILMRYEYPGNIRELENIIEYAFILCHDCSIQLQHLPENFHSDSELDHQHRVLTLAEIEKRAIAEALNRNDYKKMKTCRELGIAKDTLRRKLKAYGLE